MRDDTDLQDIFTFSEKEKTIYPFLSDYTEKIQTWLTDNTMTDEQLLRYALIGLFPSYRAANHRGEGLSTDVQDGTVRESRKRKYEAINLLLGKPITTTSEYRSLIKLTDLGNVNGDSLSEFVINNAAL
jgi:hypothetical protein